MQLRPLKRAFQMDCDSDDENSEPIEFADISITDEGHESRLVLMSAISPISYCYTATAKSLHHLLDTPIMESDFVKICVKEITACIEKRECKYGESISTDSIRNCLKMLEKLQIIEISISAGVRLISLSDSNANVSSVEEVICRLQKTIPIIS